MTSHLADRYQISQTRFRSLLGQTSDVSQVMKKMKRNAPKSKMNKERRVQVDFLINTIYTDIHHHHHPQLITTCLNHGNAPSVRERRAVPRDSKLFGPANRDDDSGRVATLPTG